MEAGEQEEQQRVEQEGEDSIGGGEEKAGEEAKKRPLFLNPTFRSLSRTNVYPTRRYLYIVGCDEEQQVFRILRLDRREERDLVIHDDGKEYTQSQIEAKLRSIEDKSGAKGVMFDKKLSGYGVFGVVRFLSGYYLIHITKRRKVAVIGGHIIYMIEDTMMISVFNKPYATQSVHPHESKYRRMFHNVDITSNFYFSYTYDLTRPLQVNMHIPTDGEVSGTEAPKPIRHCPDEKYEWSHFLMEPYRHRVHHHWVLPAIHGFVAQSNLNIFGRHIYITLVARRSRHFAGTRFLKRGCDDHGRPANDIETEQIVFDASRLSHRTGLFTSFIQLRGSVPLYWMQEQNSMKAKRPISIARPDPFASLAALHLERLFHRYGHPVIVFNLVKRKEKKKRELTLHENLSHAIDYLNQFLGDEEKIRHIPWDMSRCNKKEGTVLQKLDKFGSAFVKDLGIFHSGKPLQVVLEDKNNETNRGVYSYAANRGVQGRNQCGVVRVNCVDCLDRTNTAQFMIGLCALRHQLFALGVLPHTRSDAIPFDCPAHRLLCELYEDHGDTIALQYGGSSLVNRIQSYREKEWSTHSKDILNSVTRYYSNSFQDADKQMAINLFLGKYVPDPAIKPLWVLHDDILLHSYALRGAYPRPHPPYHLWHTPVHRPLLERFARYTLMLQERGLREGNTGEATRLVATIQQELGGKAIHDPVLAHCMEKILLTRRSQPQQLALLPPQSLSSPRRGASVKRAKRAKVPSVVQDGYFGRPDLAHYVRGDDEWDLIEDNNMLAAFCGHEAPDMSASPTASRVYDPDAIASPATDATGLAADEQEQELLALFSVPTSSRRRRQRLRSAAKMARNKRYRRLTSSNSHEEAAVLSAPNGNEDEADDSDVAVADDEGDADEDGNHADDVHGRYPGSLTTSSSRSGEGARVSLSSIPSAGRRSVDEGSPPTSTLPDDIFATPSTSPVEGSGNRHNVGILRAHSPAEFSTDPTQKPLHLSSASRHVPALQTSSAGFFSEEEEEGSSSISTSAGTAPRKLSDSVPCVESIGASRTTSKGDALVSLRQQYVDTRRHVVAQARRNMNGPPSIDAFDSEVKELLRAWKCTTPCAENFVQAARFIGARYGSYSGKIVVPRITQPRKSVSTALGLFGSIYSGQFFSSMQTNFLRNLTTTDDGSTASPFVSKTNRRYGALAITPSEKRVAAQAPVEADGYDSSSSEDDDLDDVDMLLKETFGGPKPPERTRVALKKRNRNLPSHFQDWKRAYAFAKPLSSEDTDLFRRFNLKNLGAHAFLAHLHHVKGRSGQNGPAASLDTRGSPVAGDLISGRVSSRRQRHLSFSSVSRKAAMGNVAADEEPSSFETSSSRRTATRNGSRSGQRLAAPALGPSKTGVSDRHQPPTLSRRRATSSATPAAVGEGGGKKSGAWKLTRRVTADARGLPSSPTDVARRTPARGSHARQSKVRFSDTSGALKTPTRPALRKQQSAGTDVKKPMRKQLSVDERLSLASATRSLPPAKKHASRKTVFDLFNAKARADAFGEEDSSEDDGHVLRGEEYFSERVLSSSSSSSDESDGDGSIRGSQCASPCLSRCREGQGDKHAVEPAPQPSPPPTAPQSTTTVTSPQQGAMLGDEGGDEKEAVSDESAGELPLAGRTVDARSAGLREDGDTASDAEGESGPHEISDAFSKLQAQQKLTQKADKRRHHHHHHKRGPPAYVPVIPSSCSSLYDTRPCHLWKQYFEPLSKRDEALYRGAVKVTQMAYQSELQKKVSDGEEAIRAEAALNTQIQEAVTSRSVAASATTGLELGREFLPFVRWQYTIKPTIEREIHQGLGHHHHQQQHHQQSVVVGAKAKKAPKAATLVPASLTKK